MVLRRSRVRLIRHGSLLIIGLLIGTACGSNADYDDDDDTGASQTTVATVSTREAQGSSTGSTVAGSTVADSRVPEALRFRAPLVGGGEIDMSTLAGKPVVLWFWAPY